MPPGRPLVVLLWIMNNPKAIQAGGVDARHSTLLDIGKLLHERGHTVLIDGKGPDMKPNAPEFSSFEWLSKASLNHHGRPDLIVQWVNYMHDFGGRRDGNHPLIKELMTDKEHPIPQIIYENGMQSNTVTVDPQGQLAKSFYVNRLNEIVQHNFDDQSCTRYIQSLLEHDLSKRPQQVLNDIPENISGHFIFVPTQKFEDISITKFSNFTYPRLLNDVTNFCKEQDLPLVMKIHPHLLGTREEVDQMKVFKEMKKNWQKVYLSKDSINDLTRKAFFTVTLNGGTIMDNFVTSTPVLELAPSLWYMTDAVVYETDIQRGLERMLKEASPWSEEHKLRQRQNVCWYRRMSLSPNKTGAANLEALQQHVDALTLPQPIKL